MQIHSLSEPIYALKRKLAQICEESEKIISED